MAGNPVTGGKVRTLIYLLPILLSFSVIVSDVRADDRESSGKSLLRGLENALEKAGRKVGEFLDVKPAEPRPSVPRNAPRQSLSQLDAKRIQIQLSRLGYPTGVPDGVMGPASRKAIAAYQRDRGEIQTGDLTQSQQDELLSAYSAQDSDPYPDGGGSVPGYQANSPARSGSHAGESTPDSELPDHHGGSTESAGYSGAFEKLKLKKIKGMPALSEWEKLPGGSYRSEVHALDNFISSYPDYEKLSKSALSFGRLLELIRIGATKPFVLNEKAGNVNSSEEDSALCHFAMRHLPADERAKYLISDLKWYFVGSTSCWLGENEFARAETQARFIQDYLPKLQKAAKSEFKLPISVVIVQKIVTVGKGYDKEKMGVDIRHSYAGTGGTSGSKAAPGVVVEGYKPLEFWRMDESHAKNLLPKMDVSRQGDEYRKSMTGYQRREGWLEFVVELTHVAEPSDQTRFSKESRNRFELGALHGQLKSAKVYTDADTGLTDPIYEFDVSEFLDENVIARSNAKREESHRQSSLQEVRIAGTADMLGAYAALSSRAPEAFDARIDALVLDEEDPFTREKRIDDYKKTIRQSVDRYDPNQPMWVRGKISLGQYDIEQSHFPISRIIPGGYRGGSPSGSEYTMGVLVVAGFAAEQMRNLPVPTDKARELSEMLNRHGSEDRFVAYRALVKPVKAIQSGPVPAVELEIHRLDLLAGRTDLAEERAHILDDKAVVWTFEPDPVGNPASNAQDSSAVGKASTVAPTDAASSTNSELSILGIVPGMTLSEAEGILSAHFGDRGFSRYTKSADELSAAIKKAQDQPLNWHWSHCEMKYKSCANNSSTEADRKDCERRTGDCKSYFATVKSPPPRRRMGDSDKLLDDAVLYHSEDGKEWIALYLMPGVQPRSVIAVLRSVLLPPGIREEAVLSKIKDQFGHPEKSGPRWIYGLSGKLTDKVARGACMNLTYSERRTTDWVDSAGMLSDVGYVMFGLTLAKQQIDALAEAVVSKNRQCGPLLSFEVVRGGYPAAIFSSLLGPATMLADATRRKNPEARKEDSAPALEIRF